MPSAKIGGTAFITAGGERFQLRGSLNVGIGGVERETITGQDNVHGFTEKPAAPFIEGEFSDYGTLSVAKIGKMEDVTVSAELANGKSYILRNAWSMKTPEINAENGSMSIRWEGLSGEEIL